MMRPNQPGPMCRRGPRPLHVHLAMLGLLPTSVSQPLETSTGSYFTRHPRRATAFSAADFIAGVAAYRRHPYRRTLIDPPVIWAEGNSQILDFSHGDAAGATVLVVPSLVNRAYILDLAEDRSTMRFLAAHGIRAKLLDWGWPGPIERTFNLTDYVAGRLEQAIRFVASERPVILIGYCMGGLLALAAAQRLSTQVTGLALLATPWNFHTFNPGVAQTLSALLKNAEAILLSGTLPVDALQTMFAFHDPGSAAARFAAFSKVDQNSYTAQMFVALEDWLSDGVPLPTPVARDCLVGWYQENKPASGEWRVAGQLITPDAMSMACFIAIPQYDRVVPPESARPLAQLIRHSVVIEPAAGHVAMVAGSRAERILWRPLLDWLQSL